MDDLTRCWRCRKWRYFDVTDGGVFVDDVWQCDSCVQTMIDNRVKHYTVHPKLLKWLTHARR